MAEKDQAGRKGQGTTRRADPADRGPGAHSGQEQQARPHVVPGVASGSEGYSPGGTGAGDPLQGVRADENGEREADDEASTGRDSGDRTGAEGEGEGDGDGDSKAED
ncbi:hypothetical protein ACFPA8_22770 [Streptomyces ovatisporus]|uniref:Uncharacterized protein n=1 Tax=Streptomyces ovatisporus TaxID=1128682 RepID=A0ABV9AAK8_9ACTN